MSKSKTGTREWAEKNINIQKGCEHDCAYCYARADALRFKRIESPDEWRLPLIDYDKVRKSYPKFKGVVMFPTTHDITPQNLNCYFQVLGNLLYSGNQVLIVSKPRRECIKTICEGFTEYKKQILFRFSIGALDDEILKAWEPGAPDFAERAYTLSLAHAEGFETSVSCEPLLDQTNVCELFYDLEPFITDSFWIGKMNRIRNRVHGIPEGQIAWVEEGQTDEAVREVYELLKDEPLIRWKDSYKKVLGL